MTGVAGGGVDGDVAGGAAAAPSTPSAPRFFAVASAFGAWLAAHHAAEPELQVGFHKRGSGAASMSWPESVDEALCFGWIDGIRRRIDETSYTIRFTPRRPTSIWSAVNVARVAVLMEQGRMQPAGREAFAKRSAARSTVYAYEQPDAVAMAPDDEARFRADAPAWAWFEAQAAWYRRQTVWWVMSAKRDDTRRKRLAALIDASRSGRRL